MKARFIPKMLLLLFCCLRPNTDAFSQIENGLRVSWSAIAGGGGTLRSDDYTLSGTIGQHDAGGPVANAGYSVTGGFWAFSNNAPIGDSPRLRITRLGADAALVCWPAPSVGWVLQETAALASNPTLTIWSDTTSAVVVLNGENAVTVSSSGTRYFRLVLP